MLAEVEKCTGKKIYELFDFFAGTSTGGIISLLLNKPDPLTAEEVFKIYSSDGANTIFKKNIFTPMNYLFKGEKYPKKGIETVLSENLKDYCLKDTLKPVLISSYEMESRNAVFFSNYDPRYKDILMKDVARATSAAPTYFEPYKIEGKGTFIDGGVAVNNPAMSAFIEVIKLLRKNNIEPLSKRIIVVSLGTATSSLCYNEIKNWNPLQWISGPLIDTFFNGNSRTVEHQIGNLLLPDCYFRFQLMLPNEKNADKLDNSNKKSLDKLKDLTQRYIDHDYVDNMPMNNFCYLTYLYYLYIYYILL